MANKIEAAVAPLKADAIAWAEREARGFIGRVEKELEANGWRIDIVAPSRKATTGLRRSRRRGQNTTSTARSFNRFRTSPCRAIHTSWRWPRPAPRTSSKRRWTAAAARYDAFVRKLAGKIGEVQDATLTGNHVWSHSLLTVTPPDGSQETWKTQQIVNVSKLGKPFNQWPSRKLEARQRGARR